MFRSGNLPHDSDATAGANMDGNPTAVVQFCSVATAAAKSSTDDSPLLGVVTVYDPSTKSLWPSSSATVSTTSHE